jgi:hypothetical protein
MNSEKNSDNATRDDEPVLPEPEVSGDRREAMRRIGKYTAYVAPAMLALVSTRNAAGS